MWSCPWGARTLSSMPGMIVTPSPAPAALASPRPPSVSWSVIASVATPRAAARATTSAGAKLPSEACVWAWRSMVTARIVAVRADGTAPVRGAHVR